MKETKRSRTTLCKLRRLVRLGLEPLEDRTLLDGAPVFAQFSGVLASPADTRTIDFALRPGDFRLPGGSAVLGFRVRAGTGSTLDPATAAIQTSAVVSVTPRAAADLAGASLSLTLAELSLGSYRLTVRGERGSAGAYQVEVYLPGDVNGDFRVTSRDARLSRQARGSQPGDSGYRAAADADQSGQIDSADLQLARRNRGVSTRVRPLTVSARLDSVSATDRGAGVNGAGVMVTSQTAARADVRLDQGADGSFERQTRAGRRGRFAFTLDLPTGLTPVRIEAADTFGQQAAMDLAARRTDAGNHTGSDNGPARATTPNDVSGVVPSTPEGASFGTVLAGQVYSYEASGCIVYFPEPPFTADPDGNIYSDLDCTIPLQEPYTADEKFAFPGLRALSLVGRIGKGPAFQLGSNGTFTAAETGELRLFFNDSFYADNSGSWNARIRGVPRVTEVSPANGEGQVGLTREAIVRFSDRVDPATVTASSFYAIANGERLPGQIRVSSTETFATFFPAALLPPSTEVRVVVDGSLIQGRNGVLLDADGDNIPGGHLRADFRTLSMTRIPGTHVWGFIYDSFNRQKDGSNRPVVGATIRVVGLPGVTVVTDANGRFELRDMPAPEFFVEIDGSTAVKAPGGAVYATLGKPLHSVPGQSTQISVSGKPFDIFLPPMGASDMVPLSATAATDVGFGPAGLAQLQTLFPKTDPAVWSRLQVTYPAGSAIDAAGKSATQATVIPVAPDRLPAPLPPNVSPRLVISVQAPGATQFDVPAPVTFPNLDGLAPGEKSLIFSFNHDAGRWDVIGTGTVSADGLQIVSDLGVGIRAPGWHFSFSGAVDIDRPTNQNNTDRDYNTDPNKASPHGSWLVTESLMRGVAAAMGLSIGGFSSAHLSHFLDNTGMPLTYADGSQLSDLVKADPAHLRSHQLISLVLRAELNRRLASGSTSTDVTLDLARLRPNGAFESSDLAYAIGGTQGVQITGDIHIEGTATSEN